MPTHEFWRRALLYFFDISPLDVVRRGNRILVGGRRRVNRYLAENEVRKLQIGSGSDHLQGWLNTDCDPRGPRYVFMDATARFPLPDGSIDYIFCQHLIEHFSYSQGKRMLGECLRVLKPGGRVRVCTPNLVTMLDLYRDGPGEMPLRYMRWSTEQFVPDAPGPLPCFVINNMFRNWGHQFIYDPQTLEALLLGVGFVHVERCEPNRSDHPALDGIDRGGRSAEHQEMNRFESMALEAAKGE